MKQKPHAIPDENGTLNVPNLAKHIPQPQPHLQPCVVDPEMNAVLDTTTGDMIEFRQLANGPDKEIWTKALAKDLGRLAQGVGNRMATGTNAIKFIHPKQILQDKKRKKYLSSGVHQAIEGREEQS